MINLPLACPSWDEEEIQAIQRVIDSGMFTMGQHVKQFEEGFARFLGSRYCVMVNSGSSANLLAVAALFYRQGTQLRRGDEVIVPAVSWSTTYHPLHQYGLKLKFVDIDRDTLNYDLDALTSAVTDGTRLIMAVNLLGNPNDFNAIQRIIGDRDIILIEDNCEAMGATFEGKQAGTFGLIGTFSTFFSHHISTMEGGMIVTDDEELYQILISLRAHGWTRGLPKHNHICGKLDDNPFFESFRFVLPGYNVRPLEMSGAIGIEQLKKLPEFISTRRNNAQTFMDLFNEHPYIAIQREIGHSSWFGFALIIRPHAPFDRQTVIDALAKEQVECRPIVAGNFTRNPVIQWYDYELHGKMLNADHIHENGFFIGNHHFDSKDQLHAIRHLVDSLTN